MLNGVAGDTHAISDAIMASKAVRKISFTGSTAVGKTLMRNAAETMKKVSMELGGNAPYIVFEDADIDAAVQEPSPINSAMPVRFVSALTAFSFTVQFTNVLRPNWPLKWISLASETAWIMAWSSAR